MPAVVPSTWSRSDLKRPAALVAAIAGLAITAPVATVIGCNFHEIGHAAAATMLGWEVERIDLCLPAGGQVVYERVGTWAGNLQGYAGGFIAAALLAGGYFLGFERRAWPLRGPGWWFAGLGLILPVGPQLVNGVLEGAVRPGEDYIQRYGSMLPTLAVVAMVAGAGLYARRWRLVDEVERP